MTNEKRLLIRLTADRLKRWRDGEPWRHNVKVDASMPAFNTCMFSSFAGKSGQATAQDPTAATPAAEATDRPAETGAVTPVNPRWRCPGVSDRVKRASGIRGQFPTAERPAAFCHPSFTKAWIYT